MSAHLLSKSEELANAEYTSNHTDSFADSALLPLEEAAIAGDENTFLVAKRKIKWQAQPPEHFVQAVRWALMAGALLAARQLSDEGAKKYPEHTELQKFAHILAPPTVSISKRPPDPGIRANRDWLRDNWTQYQGRWVALRSGELLSVADTIDKLIDEVGDVRNRNILITKV